MSDRNDFEYNLVNFEVFILSLEFVFLNLSKLNIIF